jgi:ATP adenylyltransferase
LFAPWRREYIKGCEVGEEAKTCVFCSAFKKGVGFDSLVLYQGQHSSVVLNKYPYNNGHTMVIPHQHTADLLELSKEAFDELHQLLKKTYEAIRRAYSPHGMNIGMNLGRVGGAGITDHLHYHLLPRWGGDTNFMPVIGGTKVISESLEQTYEKLLPLLK